MGFQSCESSDFKNFEIPNFEVDGKKDLWVEAPWPSTENTIRGIVVASPNLGCDESFESVYAYGLFMHQKCSNHTLINLLFGLCKFV
jgi:hypothetical protein